MALAVVSTAIFQARENSNTIPVIQIQTIFKEHRSFDSQLQRLYPPLLPNQVIGSVLEVTFSSFYSSVSSTVCIRRFITTAKYFFGVLSLCPCIHVVEVDGVQDFPGKHVYQSLIIGEPGPYVRYPSHSFLPRLGPQVYMLLLDCRCVQKKLHCILFLNIFSLSYPVLNGRRIKFAVQPNISACLTD